MKFIIDLLFLLLLLNLSLVLIIRYLVPSYENWKQARFEKNKYYGTGLMKPFSQDFYSALDLAIKKREEELKNKN